MDYSIFPVTEGDDEFIEDKLVEYNLSMVPPMQNKLFESIGKKIVDKRGNIIAAVLRSCTVGMSWQLTSYGSISSIAGKDWDQSCLAKLNVRQWRKTVISCIWTPSIFRQRSFMKKTVTLCSAHLRIARKAIIGII